jgi:hypothetical protein
MQTEASDVDFGERVAQERGREAGQTAPAASEAGDAADQPVTGKTGAAQSGSNSGMFGSHPSEKPKADTAAKTGGGDRERRPTAKPSIAASEPAFPGRPGKQAASSPDAAAAAGRAKLRLAEAASRQGNAAAACKLAVEAYAAVSAHAGADEDCRRVGEQAGRMLDRMGRMSRPANVPTKFE